MMRKGNGILIFLLSVIFCLTLSQGAHAVSINVGDIIKFKDGPGTTGGGEFLVYDTKDNYLFTTFCVEINEYIHYSPQKFIVDSISDKAVEGGSGGGKPDPLDPKTAYLYYQFATGRLSSYNYYDDLNERIKDANSLQRAIWYFEEEKGYPDTDAQAKIWIEEARGANWEDIKNVRVLNISWYDGNKGYKLAQSQLVLVPEPSTLLLLGAGLLGLGLVARRRKK